MCQLNEVWPIDFWPNDELSKNFKIKTPYKSFYNPNSAKNYRFILLYFQETMKRPQLYYIHI